MSKKKENHVIAMSFRRFAGRNEEAIFFGKACVSGRLLRQSSYNSILFPRKDTQDWIFWTAHLN